MQTLDSSLLDLLLPFFLCTFGRECAMTLLFF
jgi:hypothetical protein